MDRSDLAMWPVVNQREMLLPQKESAKPSTIIWWKVGQWDGPADAQNLANCSPKQTTCFVDDFQSTSSQLLCSEFNIASYPRCCKLELVLGNKWSINLLSHRICGLWAVLLLQHNFRLHWQLLGLKELGNSNLVLVKSLIKLDVGIQMDSDVLPIVLDLYT